MEIHSGPQQIAKHSRRMKNLKLTVEFLIPPAARALVNMCRVFVEKVNDWPERAVIHGNYDYDNAAGTQARMDQIQDRRQIVDMFEAVKRHNDVELAGEWSDGRVPGHKGCARGTALPLPQRFPMKVYAHASQCVR